MKIENELYESVLVDGRFFDKSKMDKLSLEQQRQMIRYAVDNRENEPNGSSENLMDALTPYITSVLIETLGTVNATDGDSIYFEDLIGHLISDYLKQNPEQKWSIENTLGCYTDNYDIKKYTGLVIPAKLPFFKRMKNIVLWRITRFKNRKMIAAHTVGGKK